ncbi:hypothetical protein [Mycobacterium simiae]|uniref:hypothetical protein n=1 Tax=Mycobacterium simiae TaxID=1784 RepID=UPI00165F44A8|nr:hypothetical protein [Mycobacterium simiae]
MLKTFWRRRDKQVPDRAVIWNLPDGHTYNTTPDTRCGGRDAMMLVPCRTRV